MPDKRSTKKINLTAPTPSKSTTLNPKSLALSLGFTFAIGVFILAIMSMFGWGNTMLLELRSIYVGYRPGIIGGIIGAIWAFIDGFIMGYLIAFFYNKLT